MSIPDFITTKYDAIIIGTDQSGPSLAARLSQAGMKIAVIERDRFGGTCVNVGCIPTKTLVASAYAAYMARQAESFGVKISGEISVDMKAVKARKDQLVKNSTTGVEGWLRKMDNCTVYQGHAKFVDPHTIDVNGEKLEADKIFLNVGCRALVPSIPGLDQVKYLTNSSIMDVDYLPKHLIVIGVGYIGLEFAQMYRRFGSEVTILARSKIMSKDDDDVVEAVADILTGEGIKILTNQKEYEVSKQGDQIQVKSAETVVGSDLLLAIGRVPNTNDLGLDKAGVETNDRGFVQVGDALETSQPHIWAMGDCNGLGAFTHTSYNDFEIVAANLLDNDPRKVSDRIFTAGLFIDPPLGRCGMSEKQARESGRKVLIGKMPMTRVGRAKEKGETRGFMKVLVDAESKQILGASLLGIGCDEVVHLLLDCMYAKAPYTVVQRAMHIHPNEPRKFRPYLRGSVCWMNVLQIFSAHSSAENLPVSQTRSGAITSS